MLSADPIMAISRESNISNPEERDAPRIPVNASPAATLALTLSI